MEGRHQQKNHNRTKTLAFRAGEAYISAEEAYISAEVAYISAEEAYISAEEPNIFAEEPYISANEAHIPAEEAYIPAEEPHIKNTKDFCIQTHCFRKDNTGSLFSLRVTSRKGLLIRMKALVV